MGDKRITAGLMIIIAIFTIAFISIFTSNIVRMSWVYDYSIKPIEIINLSLIITTTICATWYITKKLSEERFEKEILMNDLKDIESQVKNTLTLFYQGSDNNDIVVSVNQLHILINRFQQVSLSRDEITRRELEACFWPFFQSATDFSTHDNHESIDIPLVQQTGNDLIIKIRTIMFNLNSK